jgi:hypothetical protein
MDVAVFEALGTTFGPMGVAVGVLVWVILKRPSNGSASTGFTAEQKLYLRDLFDELKVAISSLRT